MKNIMFCMLLASGLVLGSCNQKASTSKSDDKLAPDLKSVKIKLADLASNKDYNCGMTLEEGAIADTTTYQGKIYGFCSSECKADFNKDPQAHLSKQ